MCARNLFQSCRNVIEELGTGGSCCADVMPGGLLETTGVSSVATCGSLTVFDSPLTVVELSLTWAGKSLTLLVAFLTIVEVFLGELLTVVVAVGTSAVPASSCEILDVLSFVTAGAVLTVGGGPLSIAGKVPEPISSIKTVFNGFCVQQLMLAGEW